MEKAAGSAIQILFELGLNALKYRLSRVSVYKAMIERHREATDEETRCVIADTERSMRENYNRMKDIISAMRWLSAHWSDGIPISLYEKFTNTDWLDWYNLE